MKIVVDTKLYHNFSIEHNKNVFELNGTLTNSLILYGNPQRMTIKSIDH